MLVCAHKEQQALLYLGKEHQIGCSGCTECQPGLLIYVRTCVCEAKFEPWSITNQAAQQ